MGTKICDDPNNSCEGDCSPKGKDDFFFISFVFCEHTLKIDCIAKKIENKGQC